MAQIKGVPVILYERTQTGLDPFLAPIYGETALVVQNVLVCPVAAEDVVNDLQLYGKRAAYELLIPKEDSHEWTDREVGLFGQRFRSFGPVTAYMVHLVPGDWNRKVRVELFE